MVAIAVVAALLTGLVRLLDAAPATQAKASERAPGVRTESDTLDLLLGASPEEARRLLSEAELELPLETLTAPGDLQPHAIESAPEFGIPVRVLLGSTATPVPEAVVLFAEGISSFGRSRLEHMAGLEPSAPEAHSRAFQADAEGLVRLPYPSRYAEVECQHDGLTGRIQLWRSQDPSIRELRLHPELALQVRVVRVEHLECGAQRQPVGAAQVAIRHRSSPDDSDTLAMRTTDDDGLVTFRGLRELSDDYRPHTEQMTVSVAGVCADPVGLRFEPSQPPAEVIELELPPCTELEVRVLSAEGQAIDFPALVRVAPRAAPDDTGLSVALVTEQGLGVFRQIGPGLELTLSVHTIEGHDFEPLELESAATPGQRKTVEIRLGSAGPSLLARLVSADGEPLASQRIATEFRSANGRTYYSSVIESDPEGRVRLPASLLGRRAGYEVAFTAHEDSPEELVGSVPIPNVLPGGEHELGDVVLFGGQLLAAGKVLADDTGLPVAGAVVRASGRPPVGRSRSRVMGQALSAENGSFAIHGEASFDEVTLSVRNSELSLVEEANFVTGTRGVVLRVRGAGGLAGNLLLPDGWYADFTNVRARQDPEQRWRYASIQRPGVFKIEGLAPGSYTVEARLDDQSDGVEIAGVVVVAGELNHDPRLVDLDLTAARYVELTIVETSGKQLDELDLHFRSANASDWEQAEVDLEGDRGYLFTTAPELDLVVQHSGYRREVLPGVRDSARIVLQPGLPVTFVWAKQPPAFPGNQQPRLYLWIDMLSTEPDRWRVDSFSRKAVDEGRAVNLPESGNYVVRYRVFSRSNSEWTEVFEQEERVVVRSADSQQISLTVPEGIFELAEQPEDPPAAD